MQHSIVENVDLSLVELDKSLEIIWCNSQFRRTFQLGDGVGTGSALGGDAGYNKDPITAFGISDASRDAQLLSEAIDDGLSGRETLDDALAGYERLRNEGAMPLCETTLRAVEYDPSTIRDAWSYGPP